MKRGRKSEGKSSSKKQKSSPAPKSHVGGDKMEEVHTTKSSRRGKSSTTSSSSSESENKFATVGRVFDNLEYGPAPESTSSVDMWLDEHKRTFGHFINNEWYHPEGRKTFETRAPADNTFLANITEGTVEDGNKAIAAAKEAQTKWAALTCHQRAKHLYAIARHIQKHERLFAVLEALDNGKSFRESRDIDLKLVVRHFYHHAGWAQLMDTELHEYKPMGVVVDIVPWNFPLMLLAWKVCPALAMGNTIVLKPAPYTSLTSILFAQVCAEAGLPAGVFNLVTGGAVIGSALADHPDTDLISFTGSTYVGGLLRRRIAGSGKRIVLELGGKSPMIVHDTADIDSAVEGCVDAIWFNQGQVCCAGSRLLVQEGVADRFIQKLKNRIDHFRLGHSLQKGIDMGPLVDEAQYKTVSGYIERAKAEGLDVYQAKCEIPNEGWFVPPTLITGCQTTNECVAEEIFGPVLTVMTFRSPAEALKLANNTKYGLGASVWTENINLALETAISVKAGAVWVNCHSVFDAAAGFGGYRQSGFGRDGGKEGLYENIRPKWQSRPRPQLNFPTSKDDIKWASATPELPAPVGVSYNSGDSMDVDRTFKMYYGGKQKRPDAPYSKPIYTPDRKELIAEVGCGNRKDIRNSVEAAHKAAGGWGKRAAHNRAQICFYIAENLTIRSQEFADRIQQMTGRNMDSCKAEVDTAIERLFYYAAFADKFGGSVQETTLYGLTTAIHEPVGVIGIACPTKFPLLGFISLIAPALVRGNTVVVIPSPEFPLCALDLYQVFDTSDLPGGVVNIITGDRDTLTKTLAEHQDVEAMWYFGSAEGSRNVEFAAADNMKRTWVNYGEERDWMNNEQGQGHEFLHESIEVKNVWVPMGEIIPGTGGSY